MDEAQLREVLGEPTELVRKKIADRLNPLTRQFVERSPFVVVATGRPDGGLDVSPRGDPAGFVRILDEFALWLNLRDVYWERQGRESIQALEIFGGGLLWVVLISPFAHAVWRHLRGRPLPQRRVER